MPKKRIVKAAVAATLVGVALLLANIMGFRSEGLQRDGECWSFGWPVIYQMRPCGIEAGLDPYFVPTSRWLFIGAPAIIDRLWPECDNPVAFNEPAIMWLDVGLGLFVLACTYFVMIAEEFERFPRQWTLRQWLAVITVVAVVLGLGHSGPFPWWPLVSWKPLVFFPILFGLLCVAMTVESRLARATAFIVRSLKARRDGDHERS